MGKSIWTIFAIVLAVMIQVNLFAQIHPKALKYYKKALAQQSNNKTSKAISYFEKAISYEANYKEAHLALYNIYLEQNEAGKAYTHLKAATVDPGRDRPNLLFNAGKLALQQGLYVESKEHLSAYLQLQSKDQATRKLAQHLLDQANYGFEHKAPVVSGPMLLPAEINTAVPEYLPSLDARGHTLVFTRRVNGNEDLFMSSTDKDGSWLPAQPWPQNTIKNEGAHVISADGKTLVFTRCDWSDGYGSCDLYISVLRSGKWTNPQNMGSSVNTNFWESQPSLSADGRTLYFASNRPGGLGGYDIWWTKRSGLVWSRPVNAGPWINTKWDELSPNRHADGSSLYFRSDGWPGYGSFDIFLARNERGKAWNTPPLNLGPTINNHEDQGALTVAIDGYTTILTLQHVNMRNELLSSDLATVNLPEQVTAAACIFIQGKVMKSKDDKHIPNAILVFTAEGIENGSDTILSDEEGDFLVVLPKNQVYQLYCNATGFDFFADRITTFEDAKNKINFDIHLDEVVAKDLGANSKPIILKNVLFEFASYTLEVGSFVELDQLFLFLQSNPDLSVAIYGHTDNAGDKLNNQLLSENRARAVYNYLVNKGLPADRLSIKGFGDSSPIATNDTEEGKAMNRRVEIKLSSIKP